MYSNHREKFTFYTIQNINLLLFSMKTSLSIVLPWTNLFEGQKLQPLCVNVLRNNKDKTAIALVEDMGDLAKYI